jgi:hypothetical protein
MAKPRKQKLPAKDWLPFFEEAKILTDALNECKSEHGKAILLGKFLSPMVGREVRVLVGNRTGKTVLRVAEDRSKAKSYFFEVTWDKQPKADEKGVTKKAKKATSKQGDDPSKAKKSKAAKKEDAQAKEKHQAGGTGTTSGKKSTTTAEPAGTTTSGKKQKGTAKQGSKKAKGNSEGWI